MSAETSSLGVHIRFLVILWFTHPCVVCCVCVDIKFAMQSFRRGYSCESLNISNIEKWHFFSASPIANICLPWSICHPWSLAFDCLDLLQPERRSNDVRESTGNSWKLRFRSHCGFRRLCMFFFRSDLLRNVQSLHRLRLLLKGSCDYDRSLNHRDRRT